MQDQFPPLASRLWARWGTSLSHSITISKTEEDDLMESSILDALHGQGAE